MIRLLPSPAFVCVLSALLAGAVVGRAEPPPAPPPPASAESPEHFVAPSANPEAEHTTPQAPPTSGTPPETHLAENVPAASSRIPDPEHEEVLGLQKLGVSLTERGDWSAAEIAYRRILISRRAGTDDLANALLGLARVYRRSGTLTKAAAIYERFLKDFPTDEHVPDALLELGRTHRSLGAHQLAIARFYSVINSTLKLSSEGFVHYQMLAKTAQFEIAETHFQQGNFAEANKFFSRLRLLDLAPSDRARAHFKSAYALYLDNDRESAVTTLQSFLEQWPGDENVPEARYLLALSLRALDRKQEALDATLTLLRSQQASGDAKRWSYWQRRTGNQLANDFFQNGDTAHALAIYQGLAALSPDPAWRLPVNYQIGLCYERLRLSQQASAAYQSIVDGAKPTAAPEPAAPAKPGEETKPAPAAPPAISAELTELARMAAWRLGQIAWHDQTEHQLTGFFSSGTVPLPPKTKTPLASPAAAANVPGVSPTPPAASLSSPHDQTGNPAPASSGL